MMLGERNLVGNAAKKNKTAQSDLFANSPVHLNTRALGQTMEQPARNNNIKRPLIV